MENITGYGSVKTRNAFKRVSTAEHYEFHLKNIRVNGSMRGCSGFMKNKKNGRIVYLNTEESVYGPLQKKTLYRVADSFKDYRGHRNNYAQKISQIVELLEVKDDQKWRR